MGIKPVRELYGLRPKSHLGPGGYLTNARRLYRVLAMLFNEGEPLIELEDYATSDVWIVTSEEAASMRMVRVPR